MWLKVKISHSVAIGPLHSILFGTFNTLNSVNALLMHFCEAENFIWIFCSCYLVLCCITTCIERLLAQWANNPTRFSSTLSFCERKQNHLHYLCEKWEWVCLCVIFKILIILPRREALCNFNHTGMLRIEWIRRTQKKSTTLWRLFIYGFLSLSWFDVVYVRVPFFGWCTGVKSHSFIFNHFIPICSDMWWFVCLLL